MEAAEVRGTWTVAQVEMVIKVMIVVMVAALEIVSKVLKKSTHQTCT